jgi:cysteine-rich repeat protein
MACVACHWILTCVWLGLAVACGGRVGADDGSVKPAPAIGGSLGTTQPGSMGGTGAIAAGGASVAGSIGTTQDPPPQRYCGNGVLESNEQCDDANVSPGDGCSRLCVVEVDFICEEPGMPCRRTSTCGDAKLGTYEDCDDGNLKDGDGCDSNCMREQGWVCRAPGRACAPRCGDARIVSGEECDNGSTNGTYIAGMTDGCSLGCKKVPSCMLAGAPNPCQGHCGDGIVDGNEECDDGDYNVDGGYGGCTTACQFAPYCGDGVVDPVHGEDCDFGMNPSATYGNGDCSATCRMPHYCGDGLIDSVFGEECDEPFTLLPSGQACDASTCKLVWWRM